MVIQRSWKILSDTGSTSASSTEANRSPSILQTSSDDSNCSIQTSHSLATSIASPPTMRLEMQSAQAAVQQSPVSGLGNVNASNIANNNTNVSSDTIKYVTTPHVAEIMLQRLRQRLSCPVHVSGTGTTSESAMRSLELLRISIQQSFDCEVAAIIKEYMENYFKPAFRNIKENLGQNVVSEEILQKMSCALLENAKAQYNPYRNVTQQACTSVSTGKSIPQCPIGDSTSLRFAVKRPPVKTVELNELPAKKLITTTQQQMQGVASGGTISIIPSCAGNANTNINTTQNFLQQPQLLPAQKQQQKSGSIPNSTTVRRQIFWNTAHISTTTKFVLDVQANQAFGFGTDGKERLASKHPELIRYLPDNEDRDWLSSQSVIALQNRNSRFLFLIYDEVCRLQQTHEIYRTKHDVDLNVMNTFTVPEFMIQKMKLFFVDLNIKSRGLITNSFSVGAGNQENSHLRNALLQGIATQNTSNNSGIKMTASNNLKNTVSSENSSGSSSLNKNNAINNTTVGNCNVASSSSDVTQLTKPSTLSSSHATLTALLNNSTNQSSQDKSTVNKLLK